MKLEIRADGLHIDGYVNVTEKMSKPVITGNGEKVIEVIEPRAFEKAIERAENITLTKDHGEDVYADTKSGTLELYEDPIGLHAATVITDEATIAEARAGKVKGWSFGMKNVKDVIEERADSLPVRKVTGLDLDHVTLVVGKTPVYAATSIEIRADEVETMEYRGFVEYKDLLVTEYTERRHDDGKIESERKTYESSTTEYDNSEFKNRLSALKMDD